MPYALKNTLASKRQNKEIWFRFYTTIGPFCTEKEEERALFDSAQSAMQTQAFSSSLSFFDIVEVNDKGESKWNE